MRVFQLTAELKRRSPGLKNVETGLWCYLHRGRLRGFKYTKKEIFLHLQGEFGDGWIDQ